MSRLWDKGAPLDERVLAYTAGDDYALDERLVKYDVRASIAHAEMLNAAAAARRTRISTSIRDGLNAIGAEHAAGQWKIELADEDGQTALEKRLTARIGAAGGRVHLGRSRNDQVLTALRLYLLDAGAELAAAAEQLRRRARCARAARRRHRPARLHPHAAGHAEQRGAVGRRLRRRAARRRGGPAPRARDAPRRVRWARPPATARPACRWIAKPTRAKLGFASVHAPVTAVQLSRGKAEAQLLFECTLLMQDLGRLASDLLLFYTQEFAFVTLPDSFTTGSSIMPQKRNPDVFELVRGRTAVAQACLAEVLGIFAKLPSGYQRDLQLIKPPLFRGIDLALATAAIMAVGHRRRAFPRRRDQTRSRRSTPPRKPTRWWCAKASRSAKPTGASARNTASSARRRRRRR